MSTNMGKTILSKNYQLTLTHYKEPLQEIPKGEGYGYYGALLSTVDGEYVQCHICGELFKSLHSHAKQSHKITNREYKIKFGLAFTTALISETMRQEAKQRTLAWLSKMTPEEKRAWKERQIERWRKFKSNRGNYQPKIQLETKNKRGTCPDQLLAKIKEVADKLGKTPALWEFVHECGTQRYKHLIFSTFGSWNNAVKLLGMDVNPPTAPPSDRPRYNDETLIEYLQMYVREHNRIPTATDCRRGILPGYEVFQRHFGSMEKARRKAGVYDLLNN